MSKFETHPCPEPSTLQSILDGSLSELEASACATHLQSCERCRQRLDEMSDDAEVRSFAAAARSWDTADLSEPRIAELLTALRDTPLEPDATAIASTNRSFLEPPRQPGDLGSIGAYRVIAEVGRGGMAIVLRGIDETLRRTVAIKVLRPELASARMTARLLHEAQAAARLQHDHVVRLYAVHSTSEGLPYLVMEYLDGQSLAERLNGRLALTPQAAAAIAAQVADGLVAAHAVGLIHRDIKPSNVHLDVSGRARILDFGLVRLVDRPSGMTQEGTLVGTPTYMSPEQVQDLPALDARTDIYSLGVTLYELLTGEAPFRGKPQVVLRQIVSEEPWPPRQLNDGVPRDLETICLKAMSKEPGRRYQTAQALADDLRHWQRGEPIRARPMNGLERGWRWCRRNPRVAGLTAALVLVFLAGLGGILWQWSTAIELRRQAEEDRDRAVRHFAQARQAVDAYLTRVSEHPGLKAHAFEPLRRELLQTARDFYEHFVTQEGDDPEIQLELGRAHARLGLITAILDTKPQALEHHQKAQAIFARLSAREPNNLLFKMELAESYLQQAGIYRATGPATSAENALQKSQTLGEELVRAAPQEPEHLHHLGRTLKERGALELFSLNHTARAEQAFREACSTYERLLRLRPNEISYQYGHGLALLYLGKAHGFTEQDELRCADCRAAAVVLEPLAKAHPENPDYAFRFADSLSELADGYLQQGLVDEAETTWRKALAVNEELAGRHPDHGYYRHCVADVTYNLATLLYHERHRLDEARLAFQKAGDIEEKLFEADPSMAEYGFYVSNIHRDLRNLFGETTRWQADLDRTTESITTEEKRPPPKRDKHRLSGLYASRAAMLVELGRCTDALTDANKALALCSAEQRPSFQFHHDVVKAKFLAEMGQYAQAARLAESVYAAKSDHGPIVYGVALAYAGLAAAVANSASLTTAERQALAERYGSRAVELLRQSRALKYFATQSTRYLLAAERRLDPLRTRGDFQRMLTVRRAKPGENQNAAGVSK